MNIKYTFFILPLLTKLKLISFCTYNIDCPLPAICCEKGPIKYCCIDTSRKLSYIPIRPTYVDQKK